MANLISAARIHRTIPSLTLIIFAIAITNNFNFKIIILGLCLLMIYSVGGIQNSYKDKDHNISKSSSKKIAILLVILALAISTIDLVIFISCILWIIFGFLYNTISRKMLLLDGTFLALTHYFIPFSAALIILDYSIKDSLIAAGIIYSIFWFIMPAKDLKGMNEDKKRGYKTLPNIKHGRTITILMFWIFLITMILAFPAFNLNKIYFAFLATMVPLHVASTIFFYYRKEEYSLAITRLSMVIFFFSLSFSITKNPLPILAGLSMVFLYLTRLIYEIKNEKL